MRSPHGRRTTARYCIPRCTTSSRTPGFSLVELLVTITLAGIIFAAMVPFFANALHATSRNNARNDAQDIAADRIEQVRLLPYHDITQSNLNIPPSSDFGDGRFGVDYATASGATYSVSYEVQELDDAEEITVHVAKGGDSHQTTMTTVVKNPAPNLVSSTSGPTPTVLPTTNLSVTATFKDWQHVTTPRPFIVRTGPIPTAAGSPTPVVTLTATAMPNAAATAVMWTGLLGGSAYTYTVSCHSSMYSSTLTSPPFHLLKSARLKFDTNPGGS
jgi:prepilin-type N-terminal cleavage/methylation domain-containing protein